MELVCFILIIMFPFTAVYADYQGDALIAFKNGLDDPGNVLQSWDTAIDTYLWFHVVFNSDNNVTRIDLGNSEIKGPLAPDLGNLTSLQIMELYDNKINGSIPKELGKLTNLVSLDLHNNNLSGPVPEELKNIPNLKVDISGNPDLCGSFTNPYKPCS